MTTFLLEAPGPVAKEVARGFVAGRLLEDDRVLSGVHPDVTEVEPEGTQITVAQASSVIETAFRTPFEADRKVIVIYEAERMNESVQNKLLKTLEEPPLDTDFLLVASSADELLPTVRSRCQTVTSLVTFPAPGAVALDQSELRRVFGSAPARLDGTGGAAAAVAGELLDAVEQAFAAVKTAHEAERQQLDAELEASGYAERAAARLRKNLAERQRRVESRARVDAIVDGLTALESAYRDTLVASDGPAAAAALAAIDHVNATLRAIHEGAVLNWGLQLEALLLRLPGTLTASHHPPG